jgi:hypothetical protein
MPKDNARNGYELLLSLTRMSAQRTSLLDLLLEKIDAHDIDALHRAMTSHIP